MIVSDTYYILFIAAWFVLLISFIHAIHIVQTLPDKLILILLSALIVVCAYNAVIGNYVTSLQIENAGYFMLAWVIVAWILNFTYDSIGTLIGIVCVLLFLGAGALGGSDYGSSWLYDQTNMHITTNAFLLIMIVMISIGFLIWWKLSSNPWFLWIISVLLLMISNGFSFSIIVGRCEGWRDNTGDSYGVLTIDASLVTYLLAGLAWYIIPSYLSYKYQTTSNIKE